MILKFAFITAAFFGAMYMLAGTGIRAHRTVTLNELKYEITRHGHDRWEVAREDGLRFLVQMKDGAIQLASGTQAQLEDATNQMRKTLLSELSRGAL